MPRTSRKSYEKKQFFHVMVQGIDREFIFNTNEEKEVYKKLMIKYANKMHIKIVAYCIMDNHVHILVQIKEISELSKYMQCVNTSYAIYYNKKKKRVGYVYRNRYQVQVIQNVKHLKNAIIYIHNNPLKAKICESADEYAFSSYQQWAEKLKDNTSNDISLFTDLQEYKKMHKDDHVQEEFLDVQKDKKTIAKNVIQIYLNQKHITWQELKNNRLMLKQICKELHEKERISYRKIEEIINISRETIRKMIKE